MIYVLRKKDSFALHSHPFANIYVETDSWPAKKNVTTETLKTTMAVQIAVNLKKAGPARKLLHPVFHFVEMASWFLLKNATMEGNKMKTGVIKTAKQKQDSIAEMEEFEGKMSVMTLIRKMKTGVRMNAKLRKIGFVHKSRQFVNEFLLKKIQHLVLMKMLSKL